MKKLEFGTDASMSQILESIKASEEESVDLSLPEDSPIFSNPINKEIIEKYAQKSGKKINVVGGVVAAAAAAKAADEFGFVEGHDIADSHKTQLEEPTVATDTKEPAKPVDKTKKGKGPFSFFSRLSGRKKLLIWGAIGLVITLVLLFTSFWFLPSADVTVNIESETETNQLTLKASQEADEVDLEKKIIPLTVEEVTKSDVRKADATGKLTLGSPAKGRVTVGNFSIVTTKKFPAGTTITSVSGQNTGLEFTLDTEVSVPKASTSGAIRTAGQAGVNVTAKKIGSEGNLPASTEFQVGNEDIGTVNGINDLALSGGESKQVTAVSEEDRKKLREDLLEELSKKAKEDLESKLEGAKVPEGGLKTEVVEESFDKAAGEEAKEVSLTMKVKATAKLFQEEDLKKLMIESISPSVPEGLVVDEDKSTVEAELFETEGEADIELLGKIDAVLVPDIAEDSLRSTLSGRSFGSAASYLQSQENISGFEIEIKPAIFRLFKFMPFNGSRINIVINSQEDSSVDSEAEEEEGKEEETTEDAE